MHQGHWHTVFFLEVFISLSVFSVRVILASNNELSRIFCLQSFRMVWGDLVSVPLSFSSFFLKRNIYFFETGSCCAALAGLNVRSYPSASACQVFSSSLSLVIFPLLRNFLLLVQFHYSVLVCFLFLYKSTWLIRSGPLRIVSFD
jgi:hypothetical protein